MKTSEAIESLERRADYLAQKIARSDSEKPLHFERQELAALKLAISELEAKRERRLAQ